METIYELIIRSSMLNRGGLIKPTYTNLRKLQMPLLNKYYFIRFLCLVGLLLLAIIEIQPIPITTLTAIYILLFRPYWFKNLIDKVYSSKPLLDLSQILNKKNRN